MKVGAIGWACSWDGRRKECTQGLAEEIFENFPP
jgi:hypothetical protein